MYSLYPVPDLCAFTHTPHIATHPHSCSQACTHTYHPFIYACSHIHSYPHIHSHVLTVAHMHILIHTCACLTHAYTHTPAHTLSPHTHTHTHTFSHIHTNTCCAWSDFVTHSVVHKIQNTQSLQKQSSNP
jgi:hypothetical protein